MLERMNETANKAINGNFVAEISKVGEEFLVSVKHHNTDEDPCAGQNQVVSEIYKVLGACNLDKVGSVSHSGGCASVRAKAEPKKYFIAEDDACREEIEAESMEEAIELASEKWQDGSWDGKCIVNLRVQELNENREIVDVEYVDVECGDDPEAPECEDGEEHDWCSPHEVVGGMTENPGVFSKSGTTIVFVTVCSKCGCKKVETNYGSQRNPQQCDQIEYDTEDESALDWAKSVKENQ